MAGAVDTLEVACLWSDEAGTAEVWYRLLNVGVPIALSAGTDAFSNFYRSMAVGTTRVYVRVEGELSLPSYLDGLRRGRSFVTTGPFLDFRGKEARPGDVIEAGEVEFTIELASAMPVDQVEVLVNGKAVFEDEAQPRSGPRLRARAARLARRRRQEARGGLRRFGDFGPQGALRGGPAQARSAEPVTSAPAREDSRSIRRLRMAGVRCHGDEEDGTRRSGSSPTEASRPRPRRDPETSL
jgi:hypothetical protein